MSSLQHETINRVHGASVVGDTAYLVMDYYDNKDLHAYLRASADTLSWKQKLHLSLQAAQPVEILHNRNNPILHRDIKASNFLIDVSKHSQRLLLADFGLAHVQGTVRDTKLGTINCIAPEVLSQPPIWTEKADIYSLGMVLYEIATGKTPFEGYNPAKFVDLILRGERPSIPPAVPQVSLSSPFANN